MKQGVKTSSAAKTPTLRALRIFPAGVNLNAIPPQKQHISIWKTPQAKFTQAANTDKMSKN